MEKNINVQGDEIMLEMNDLMKAVLSADIDKSENFRQVDAVLREIESKTKLIKDCIIYDKSGDLDEEKINFSKIMQFVGDLTGYEVSCNELRFDKAYISPGQFELLADRLNEMLSEKFNRKTVIYISLPEDKIELRFHTYRENEGLWLNENLNSYDVPILCRI